MLKEERQLLKLLYRGGFITKEQRDLAINIQKHMHQWLGVTLVVNRIITDVYITKLFATLYADTVLAPIERRRRKRAVTQKLADAIIL